MLLGGQALPPGRFMAVWTIFYAKSILKEERDAKEGGESCAPINEQYGRAPRPNEDERAPLLDNRV